MSEYAKRDHIALGAHYLRHVEAMTAEGLHRKSDIAAELAHRDAAREADEALMRQALEALESCLTDPLDDTTLQDAAIAALRARLGECKT